MLVPSGISKSIRHSQDITGPPTYHYPFYSGRDSDTNTYTERDKDTDKSKTDRDRDKDDNEKHHVESLLRMKYKNLKNKRIFVKICALLASLRQMSDN